MRVRPACKLTKRSPLLVALHAPLRWPGVAGQCWPANPGRAACWRLPGLMVGTAATGRLLRCSLIGWMLALCGWRRHHGGLACSGCCWRLVWHRAGPGPVAIPDAGTPESAVAWSDVVQGGVYSMACCWRALCRYGGRRLWLAEGSTAVACVMSVGRCCGRRQLPKYRSVGSPSAGASAGLDAGHALSRV